MADDDESTCWICLAGAEELQAEGEEEPSCLAAHHPPSQPPDPATATARSRPPAAAAPLGPLLQVCACPRRVHASCCARWQLHSAGKR